MFFPQHTVCCKTFLLFFFVFSFGIVMAFEKTKEVTIKDSDIKIRFALIPAGKFMMGSNSIPESTPVRMVKIHSPFWMGVFEVTSAQWEAVMKKQDTVGGTSSGPAKNYASGDYPVENINLDELKRFIQILNQSGIGKFRLPTEAEWEYACRAGSDTIYVWGNESDKAGEYAWSRANARTTQKVGRKKPNAWGLYDMSGNVMEWVDTQYLPYTDGKYSLYKSQHTSLNVCRGGSYSHDIPDLASAMRFKSRNAASPNLGFRLVMEVEMDKSAVDAAVKEENLPQLKFLAKAYSGMKGVNRIHGKIASLLFRKGMNEEAVNYLLEVQAETMIRDADYYYCLMDADFEASRHRKNGLMIPVYEKELARGDKLAAIWSLILNSYYAKALDSIREPEKALKFYREALKHYIPGHNNSYSMLMHKANCELSLGMKEAAAETLKQIISDTRFSENRKKTASDMLEKIRNNQRSAVR